MHETLNGGRLGKDQNTKGILWAVLPYIMLALRTNGPQMTIS